MRELTSDRLDSVLKAGPRAAFDAPVIAFFDALSTAVMRHPAAKPYPDLATYGFFIRPRNLKQLQQRYVQDILIGKGQAFHIGPANVALNFAYSLTASLLAGNPTVVRVSSRDFVQADILITLIDNALASSGIPDMLAIVQYDHGSEYNRILSEACDVRVIWGGDETIARLRDFPIKPHASELHFANRYSALVIDADHYLAACDPDEVARKVFNDVYPSDQNACTAPKLVFWLGNQSEIETAKPLFWQALSAVLTQSDYRTIEGVGVRHFKSSARIAAQFNATQAVGLHPHLTVLDITSCSAHMIDAAGAEGFFMQAHIADLADFAAFLDHRCQTMAYIGDLKTRLIDLVASHGLKAIDRVVPVGSTGNFSFVWEGKDLIRSMSRSFA